MRYLELFAGAGGLSQGLERAGMTCVAHAEIADFPRRILAHRWPGVPLYGDVSSIDGRELVRKHGPVDIVAGGSPCQDMSIAGKREGLEGSRSILFYEQVRLYNETEAPYLLWENVAGALSSNAGKDFAAVISALVGSTIAVPRNGWAGEESGGGVAAGPAGVAAWRLLDAQHFGVPQRRLRVFVLCARAGGVDPAEVLLEPQSLRRDTPTRRASGKITPAIPAGGAGTARTGNARTEGDLVIYDTTQVTNPNNRSNPQPGAPSHALAAGADAPLRVAAHTIAFKSGQSEEAGGIFVTDELAPTLQGQNNGSTAVPSVLSFGHQNSASQGDDVVVEGCAALRTTTTPANIAGVEPEPEALFLHVNKGRPAGRESDHEEMVSVKDHVPTLTTDGHARSGVVQRMVSFGEYTEDNKTGPLLTRNLDNHGAGDLVIDAIPIQNAASARSGENLTPTADADGRVRIRPSGLGVGESGDPMFTLDATAPHSVFVEGDTLRTSRFTCLGCSRRYGIDDYERNPTCPGCGSMKCDDMLDGIDADDYDDEIIGALCAGTMRSVSDQQAKSGHIVVSRLASFGEYVEDDVAGTRGERDHKSATDIVLEDSDTVGSLCASDGKSQFYGAQAVASGHVVGSDDPLAVNISGGVVDAAPVMGTLGARSGGSEVGAQTRGVVLAGIPRRLMPIECERLMDWPDGWTDVPDEKGKPASDAVRYKACGNGVVSACSEWIGERLLAAEAMAGPRP